MAFDPSSREAEAQAEIAATRLGRGAAAALVAGGVLLLASGPLAELPALLRGASSIFAPFGVANANANPLAAIRQRIDEIELRYDERSALVRWIRPRAQSLLTRFGGYGNESAILGRDGWLFFRDDVEHLVSRRPAPDSAGDPWVAIVGFRDRLAQRGIGLVVVPTPLKPTVHPGPLAAGAAPPIRRHGEADRLAELAAAGVPVLDLAARFARDTAIAPLYLLTDTHWRPEAMEIAAREIALLLRERFPLAPGDAALRESEPRRLAAVGDTAKMLELPPAAPLTTAESVTTLPPQRGTEPEAGRPTEVLLLGDSFSAIYSSPDLGWGAGAGLADRLAAQLGLPVDRIVRNAGGASATRQALAAAWRRDPDRFAALRVVVWQFAARELSQGEWSQVDLP